MSVTRAEFLSVVERVDRLEASQETRRQQIVAILGEMNEQAKATANHAAATQQAMEQTAQTMTSVAQTQSDMRDSMEAMAERTAKLELLFRDEPNNEDPGNGRMT